MSKVESNTAKFRRLITEGLSLEDAIQQAGITEITARVQLHNLRKQGISAAIAVGSRKSRAAKPKPVAAQPKEEEELDGAVEPEEDEVIVDEEEDVDDDDDWGDDDDDL